MAPLTDEQKEQKKRNKILEEAKKILNEAKDPEKALKDLDPKYRKALKEQYGYAFALIMGDESLTKLFTDAIKKSYTETGFIQELQRTSWYRERLPSQREFDALIKDPAQKGTLLAKIEEAKLAVQRQAKDTAGIDVSDAEANKIAKDLVRDHSTDWLSFVPRVVDSIYVTDNVLEYGGKAATALTTIREHAKNMGVFLDDTTLGRYVDNIFAEKETLENVINGISNQAATYYPQFADNIKSGATVASIAAQYTETAAAMLEDDPQKFSFYGNNPVKSDPLMAKAMFGGKDGKAMSIYDFRKAVKQDARWKKTRNAREEYASTINAILRSFGG